MSQRASDRGWLAGRLDVCGQRYRPAKSVAVKLAPSIITPTFGPEDIRAGCSYCARNWRWSLQ